MALTQYISEAIIEIDGKKVPSIQEDLLQLSVEESLHRPGMFTLVIHSPGLPAQPDEDAKRAEYESLFTIGKKVKFTFKSNATESDEFKAQIEATVLEGEITAIETHFTAGSQAPLIIRGYDVSHRLFRGRHNRSFQNYTDTDIVSEVIGESGISAGTMDSSGAPHDYIFQENQTDMEFLRERAAKNGFELFVEDGKLNFKKPQKIGESITLKWLKDLSSFHVNTTSSEQVSSVEVRGWDYKEKKAFVATKNAATVITKTDQGEGKATSSKFNGKPSSPKLIVVDEPVFTQKEADTLAQALINEVGGEFVQAEAIAQGNPKIRPGRIVTLKDMGKYSGDYYITETRHLFIERVYTTEFSARGLRGGDLITLLSPTPKPRPGQTMMVGRVTNNQDPEGWGRVRVKLPTLTEEHESNWARVVSAGAGANRGFDCLPEVDDEVLVAFEHGDIRRPYIIGNVWNGKDVPPEKVDESVVDGKVRLRTFKTRLGHILQFVEEDKGDSKQGIYLTTKDKHYLKFNDTDQVVELKTTGGHTLTLDDKNKKIDFISTDDMNIKTGKSGSSKKLSIDAGEIAITGATKITLKVGSNSIELSSSGIKISGAKIDIKANSMATIEGTKTDVKGSAMVQIQGGLVKIN
jgi:uncharacterized protein involved in type VI secretion and phage assembly